MKNDLLWKFNLYLEEARIIWSRKNRSEYSIIGLETYLVYLFYFFRDEFDHFWFDHTGPAILDRRAGAVFEIIFHKNAILHKNTNHSNIIDYSDNLPGVTTGFDKGHQNITRSRRCLTQGQPWRYSSSLVIQKSPTHIDHY